MFVSSPTKVYIDTSIKSPYYSQNDEETKKLPVKPLKDSLEEKVRFIEVLEDTWWLSVRTVLRDGEFEIQDLVAFIGN